MKKVSIILATHFIIIAAYSQDTTRIKDSLFGCNVLFTKCQVDPQFVEGENVFKEFIEKNINIKAAYNYLSKSEKRALEKEAPILNVYLRFTVSCDGKISDIGADERSNNMGAIEEAKRLIQLSQQWKPGTQNGYNVRSLKRVKITFDLVQ